MNNVDKLLLSEEEAAHLLSMSTHFLRRDRISAPQVSIGIPFIRLGGAVRYSRADLEAWILELTRKALLPKVCIEVKLDDPAKKRGPGRPRKAAQVAARRQKVLEQSSVV